MVRTAQSGEIWGEDSSVWVHMWLGLFSLGIYGVRTAQSDLQKVSQLKLKVPVSI